MKTFRDKQLIQSKLAELGSIMPLTHLLSETDRFITLLSGDFSFPQETADGKTFEFRSNGRIIIICPVPEALLKLSFTMTALDNINNNIKFYQGSDLLHELKLAGKQNLDLYLSLIEGLNPIDCLLSNNSNLPAEISLTFNKKSPLRRLA